MMKKLSLLTLALVLTAPALLFSSAGAEAAQELPTIQWATPPGAGYPYDAEQEQAVYDEFNEMFSQEIGAKIQVRTMSTGEGDPYHQKLTMLIAAGEPLDLMTVKSLFMSGVQMSLDGNHMPLEELLPKFAPKTWAAKKADWDPLTMDDGHIYLVPTDPPGMRRIFAEVLKKDVERYGWDLSKVRSYYDLKPFCEDIKANEPDRYPFGRLLLTNFYNHAGRLRIWQILYSRYIDPQGEVFNLYESEEWMDVLKDNREWYLNGYLPQDIAAMSGSEKKTLYNQGKIAMSFQWGWDGVIEFDSPAGTRIKVPISDNVRKVRPRWGNSYAVSANSDLGSECVKLMELMQTNADAVNLLAYGIEGRHYESEEGIWWIPNKESGYYPANAGIFGNPMVALQVEGAPKDRWDIYRRDLEKAVLPTLYAYTFNAEPVKTEMSNVQAVIQEYENPIRCGAVDPEEYVAKFNAELEKAGIDDLIAEVQVQVDEHLGK